MEEKGGEGVIKEIEVTKQDGSKEKKYVLDPVAPANNFMQTLFDSVKIYLGTNQQELEEPSYPYISYLKTLWSRHSQDRSLRSQGFAIDYASKSTSNTSLTNQYLGIRHWNVAQTPHCRLLYTIIMICVNKDTSNSFYSHIS